VISSIDICNDMMVIGMMDGRVYYSQYLNNTAFSELHLLTLPINASRISSTEAGPVYVKIHDFRVVAIASNDGMFYIFSLIDGILDTSNSPLCLYSVDTKDTLFAVHRLPRHFVACAYTGRTYLFPLVREVRSRACFFNSSLLLSEGAVKLFNTGKCSYIICPMGR
jgi:hypothetical protein